MSPLFGLVRISERPRQAENARLSRLLRQMRRMVQEVRTAVGKGGSDRDLELRLERFFKKYGSKV